MRTQSGENENSDCSNTNVTNYNSIKKDAKNFYQSPEKEKTPNMTPKIVKAKNKSLLTSSISNSENTNLDLTQLSYSSINSSNNININANNNNTSLNNKNETRSNSKQQVPSRTG
jgi:hypothetical protein